MTLSGLVLQQAVGITKSPLVNSSTRSVTSPGSIVTNPNSYSVPFQPILFGYSLFGVGDGFWGYNFTTGVFANKITGGPTLYQIPHIPEINDQETWQDWLSSNGLIGCAPPGQASLSRCYVPQVDLDENDIIGILWNWFHR